MTLRAAKGQHPQLSVETDDELSTIETGYLLDGDFLYSAASGVWILKKSATDDAVAGAVVNTLESDDGASPGRLFFTGIGPIGPTTGGLSFTSRALLSDYDTTAANLTSGAEARTTNVVAKWRFDATSELTVDGTNVLSATPAGRWIRVQECIFIYANQPTWYCDLSTGDDENDGLTTGTALRTITEWFLRTQACFATSMTVNVIGNPGADPGYFFGYAPRPINGTASNNSFTLKGSLIQSRTGTMTAAATAQVPASNAAPTVTDSGVASWAADVGRLIYTTSGALAAAVILKNVGGGVARVSNWFDPNTGSSASAPANGTTYQVVDVSSLAFSEVMTSGSANFFLTRIKPLSAFRTERGFRAIYQECQLTTGISNGGYAGGGAQISGCAITGSDFILEGGNVTLIQYCGITAQLGVNGGSRLILVNNVLQGVSLSLGHGSAGVLAPFGGFCGLIGDNGIFDVAGTAFQCDQGGLAYIVSSATLYGSGNTVGTSVIRGGTLLVRSTYVPTLTGTTELSVTGGASGITPPNALHSGTSTLVGGTKTIASTSTTATATITATRKAPAGTLGAGGLTVPTRTANTSFVVNAVDLAGALVATETSTFDWQMIEPPATVTTWANWNAAPFSRNLLTNDYSRILTA